MKLKDLHQIGIVGPGLLGGSLGLALKAKSISARIIGVGHRQSSLDRAVEIGAIDQGSLSLSDLSECKLVIIATPISQIKGYIDSLKDVLSAGSIVTDVGSTKREICQWSQSLRKKKIEFVGSHPIAGSEKRGVDFARVDLFVNAWCFVTKTRHNTPSAIELIAELWKTIGMRVVQSTPSDHDNLLASISHLPHIAAAALVNACTMEQIKFCGTGFLDTTRIASGDVPLWNDIVMSNSDFIVSSLKKFSKELDRFIRAADKKDYKRICDLLSSAKNKRDELVRLKYEQKEID